MKAPLLNNERKVFIGFKCSPPLKSTLCEKADKLGISLSSHVETILLTHHSNKNKIKQLSEQIEILNERISFYKNLQNRTDY